MLSDNFNNFHHIWYLSTFSGLFSSKTETQKKHKHSKALTLQKRVIWATKDIVIFLSIKQILGFILFNYLKNIDHSYLKKLTLDNFPCLLFYIS